MIGESINKVKNRKAACRASSVLPKMVKMTDAAVDMIIDLVDQSIIEGVILQNGNVAT